MIVYIYNIGVDLYNGFNGLRHRINWTYFTVLDGLAHPLYSHVNLNNKMNMLFSIGVAAYAPLSALLPAMVPDNKVEAVSILNLGSGLSNFVGPLLVTLLFEKTSGLVV